jgi:hypothetical protein
MFSFNRLKHVVRHDWTSVRKNYFIFMAVLFMVQLCISFFFHAHSARLVVYIGMIVAFGMMTFAEYTDRNRRIGALLLPATTAEKYASQWLLSFLLFPVTAIVAVSLGETLGTLLWWYLDWNVCFFDSWLLYVNWPSFLVGLLGLESIAFAGALFFRKNSALKTWACVAAYAIVMFFVMIAIILFKFRHFVEDGGGTMNLSTDEYMSQFKLYVDSVDVGMWWGTATAITVITLVVSAFLQVWTYFRLKEEEGQQ